MLLGIRAVRFSALMAELCKSGARARHGPDCESQEVFYIQTFRARGEPDGEIR